MGRRHLRRIRQNKIQEHRKKLEKPTGRYTRITLLLLKKLNGFRDIIILIMSQVKYIETIQYYKDIHKEYDFNLLFSIKLLYPEFIVTPVNGRYIPATLEQQLYTVNKVRFDKLSNQVSTYQTHDFQYSLQYEYYLAYIHIRNQLNNFINSNGLHGGAYYCNDYERVIFSGYTYCVKYN